MGDYTNSPPQSASSSASSVPASNLFADSNTLEPNRPDSTILADSPPEATPSAQPNPANSEAQPVSESDLQPHQVLEASASADTIPPANSTPETSSSAEPSVPISLQYPISPQSNDSSVSPQPKPTPSEATKESSIQDTSPTNPPPQVQPSVPTNTPSAPTVSIDQPPKESATIEPKPLEAPQNTIPADSKPPETPKTTSFGDLMGNPSDLSDEPAIHIDTIEAPPVQPSPPPISPSSPSDPSLPSDPSDQTDEQSDERRLHANEVRKQKKEDNLAKIIMFVQSQGKATNLDIRDYLHISQSTTTGYLRTLVNSGKLKKEGKAKATKYYF